MKKLTTIAIIILGIINLLTFPIFKDLDSSNTAIDNLLTNIPANTIYVNSNINPTDVDNSQFIKQLQSLDNVKSVQAHNIYKLETLYYDGKIDSSTNQVVGRYTIPTIILDSPNQQKYDIIAGQNLMGDGQIVISSAFVENLGKTPEEMIGQSISSLNIVGVYDDPNPYQQFDDEHSLRIANYNNYQTSNLAYTVDSELQANNLMKSDNTISGAYNDKNLLQTQQALEITFVNNQTQNNLDMLLNTIGNGNIYVSNLGIEDQSNQLFIYSILSTCINKLAISLSVVDILVVGLIVFINRKER